MRKILIIFTAIIFTFAFFYSCTIPIDDPDDGSIEKPGNEIPDPPENLQADIVTNDTIVISWDPVSNATAYKVIYYTYLYIYNRTEEIMVSSGETCELTLLNSLVDYQIRVYSYNWAGYSLEASTIFVQTLEAYGSVLFDGDSYVASDGICIVSIDGQYVGTATNLSRSFTTNQLTGWRFMLIEYKRLDPDPFQYKTFWFYLTTEGTTINFDDL